MADCGFVVVVLEESVQQKSIAVTSYLMSSVKPQHPSTSSSPWEELPSSHEQFGCIPNYQLYDEIDSDDKMQHWDLQSGLADNVASISPVVASSSIQLFDSATVPDGNASVEDIWLDFKDEAISDVFMDNALKLAGIVQYLPTVSADDVESLLSSSPSIADTTASDNLEIASWHSHVTEYHGDQINGVSGVLSTQVEPSAEVPCMPVYEDQLQVASPPVMTQVAVSAEQQVAFSPGVSSCLSAYDDQFHLASPQVDVPAYDEQIQVPSPVSTVPSPMSSQSTLSPISTPPPLPPSTDKRLRKKEQNKTAAQKYRQKKRGERGVVMSEYEQLERKNIELHTRVDEMTREVNYLKRLIEEICA